MPPVPVNPPKKANGLAIGIVSIVLIALLVLAYTLSGPKSCSRDYQDKECWKEENSRRGECINLEECMGQDDDGDTDYVEYLVTFGAACVFIYQKYQREITRVLWTLKE